MNRNPPPIKDLQAEPLLGRRLAVLGLTVASWLALGALAARVLDIGHDLGRAAILLLFLAGLPWTLLGFWNSAIGFAILRLVADPAGYTNLALRRTPPGFPITSRVAVCVAVRHENVPAVIDRLTVMIDATFATPDARAFDFHLLSDSTDPVIAAAERDAVAALQGRWLGVAVGYRRRASNAGFKAGNLRDFARSHSGAYDHMLVLDADSLMSAAAMRRLVRVMEANPRLGILQSLVVGRPATTAFARIFQFGMRHSMRVHTTGIAWWQGPSGPYWGHNAIIRIAPYLEHCELPLLGGGPPLGGAIMSHDQVEAVLMRAAGYEVRVIADEFGSFEENPPSLPDFIKRDLRWCQGNLQYLKLIGRPGATGRDFTAMGRLQLVNAIMMYMGAPAWVLMLLIGLAEAISPTDGAAGFHASAGAAGLYFGMLAIGIAPRLLGAIDVGLDPQRRRRYGGGARLLAGSAVDALFSFLLGPVMALAQAGFMAGLPFGRRILWEPQRREGHFVSFRAALLGLWPQCAFGVVFAVVLAGTAPGAVPWALPTILGCLLAPAFAAATSSLRLSRLLARLRLCAIPEEQDETRARTSKDQGSALDPLKAKP